MLNQIGLKAVVNKVDKEKDLQIQEGNQETKLTDLKDIEEDKFMERKIKLLEYCKLKRKENINNDIDNLIWLNLEDGIKQFINEELSKSSL